MSRSIRSFHFISLIVVLIVGGAAARPAAACTCAMPGTPQVELGRSALVFEGTVTSISQDEGALFIETKVLRRWKAPDVATITLTTGAFSGSCGVSVHVGETWLFYVVGDCKGLLAVSICSRSRLIGDAGEDLAALGAPLAAGVGGGCDVLGADGGGQGDMGGPTISTSGCSASGRAGGAPPVVLSVLLLAGLLRSAKWLRARAGRAKQLRAAATGSRV